MSRDPSKPFVVGSWCTNQVDYRLVRTCAFDRADLILERADEDSMGERKWVAIDSQPADTVSPSYAHHALALCQKINRMERARVRAMDRIADENATRI